MINFDEYIRQGEPEKKEKTEIWRTAIGLQQVDGLKPSAYLIETAKKNIEGEITFEEAKSRIDNYYKNLNTPNNLRINDADKLGVNNKKFSVMFNENQEKLLSLIEKTPGITANEMAKLIGISERGVNKNLAKFKELNILTRIGLIKQAVGKF